MCAVKYRTTDAPFHIALLGRSGVGKSSLCNSLRHLSTDADQAAAVGVVETTRSPTSYRWMENVLLWDVPGVSTPSVSKEDYCQLININRYDVFLILSRTRFTEIDLWLIDLVQHRFDKTRFFIRTGIDEELRNHRRDFPTNFQSDLVLQTIRENCLTNVQTTASKTDFSLYLINTKDRNKFDFPQLIDDLMKHVHSERDNRVLTVIKDDSPSSRTSTLLQTAQTIVTSWRPQYDFFSYFSNRFRQ